MAIYKLNLNNREKVDQYSYRTVTEAEEGIESGLYRLINFLCRPDPFHWRSSKVNCVCLHVLHIAELDADPRG